MWVYFASLSAGLLGSVVWMRWQMPNTAVMVTWRRMVAVAGCACLVFALLLRP